MKLRVMTKDIRGAHKNHHKDCPLARAFMRLHPGNDVDVFDEYLVVNGKRFEHSMDTAAMALDWNEGPVFAQTLTLPEGIETALILRKKNK